MAVVHAKEITGREGTDDNRSNVRYTRVFQLLTDSNLDGAKLVLACPLIPAVGDTWETIDDVGAPIEQDLDAFCVERHVVSASRDLYREWIVICSYVGKGDPTLEPPAVSCTTVKYQKSYQKDINGLLYGTTIGEPFEGGIVRDKSRFTITIKRNVLSWNPIEAEPFLDTTNSLPFLGVRYAPGFDIDTCKLSELSAEAVWFEDNSDIHYYVRTARIEIDKDGWNCKPLNAGYEVYDSTSPTGRSPYLSGLGRSPVIVPLAEDGAPLPSGSDPVYREDFVDYLSADWTVLDLEF